VPEEVALCRRKTVKPWVKREWKEEEGPKGTIEKDDDGVGPDLRTRSMGGEVRGGRRLGGGLRCD
jgi:hypothetical protein